MEKAQIIIYSQKSVNYTPFDIKWIPSTPRFVTLGQQANGTGILEVMKLSKGSIEIVSKTEKPFAFKCGTFGASNVVKPKLATGDFGGRLLVWDLERLEKPVWSVKGHDQIINHVDGFGGKEVNNGPPEIITCSRDGTVKVWDIRQQDPVCILGPKEGDSIIDPWCATFGNSHDNQERMIAGGYENGDLKLFDMRQMKLVWETNLKNGICSIEFDRKNIEMNKLVVTGLESKFFVFDLRTFHPTIGYSYLQQKVSKENTTGWCVRHLPQNRDVFMMSSGSGSLDLFQYRYPANRKKKEEDGSESGVVGKVELIQSATVAEQPIGSFDWSADKMGLLAMAAFDQQVRIGMVTRLQNL